MSKVDLQIAAVERAERALGDPDLIAVRRTLEWIKAHRDVLETAIALIKHPEVAATREAYPGTRMGAV